MTILLKVFQIKGVNTSIGITVNYIVAAILAFVFAPKLMGVNEIVHSPWFNMAVLIGFLFMVSFVVYLFSVQRSGVAVTAVWGRAAMAIPVIFAWSAPFYL